MNEHQKPWVWFPGQLPFFTKADRIQDVTFHCPESAKIYVDRVVQHVPVLHETLSCDVGTDPVHQGNSTVPSMTCETSSLASWTRKERGAKRFRTSIGGPPWNQVVKRVTKCINSGQVIAEEDVQGMKGAELFAKIPGGPRDIETTLYFKPPTGVKEANHACEPKASNDSKFGIKPDQVALSGGDAVMHPPVSGNPVAEPSSSSKGPAWDIVHPPRPLPPEVETPRPLRVGCPKQRHRRRFLQRQVNADLLLKSKSQNQDR